MSIGGVGVGAHKASFAFPDQNLAESGPNRHAGSFKSPRKAVALRQGAAEKYSSARTHAMARSTLRTCPDAKAQEAAAYPVGADALLEGKLHHAVAHLATLYLRAIPQKCIPGLHRTSAVAHGSVGRVRRSFSFPCL